MSSARYASHLALPQIGPEGQARLARAHVLLVGLGGIGAPAALYLAGAGIGRLTLADFDRVAETNLSRQLLYGPGDVGLRKTEVAARRLAEINPDCDIDTLEQRVTAAALVERAADVWIDTSDNYATRLACNEAALRLGQRWVMAAALRFEGQLAVFTQLGDEACYRCLYGDAAETLEDCAGAGVFAPAAGIMGLAGAAQAMALITGLEPVRGLHLFDATTLGWQALATRRRPDCPACGG